MSQTENSNQDFFPGVGEHDSVYVLCASVYVLRGHLLGKGLTSWLSFVVSSVSLSLSHWYPGSGVVLDCIDS